MTRPSHYLLALFAAAGLMLWLTGGIERLRDRSPPVGGDGPVVVRRTGDPPRARAVADEMLVGRVIDARGWPLSGATVFAPTGAKRVTGPDGGFALPTRRAGIQDVRVTADDALTAVVPMTPGETSVVMLEDALPWEDPDRSVPSVRRGLLAGEGFLENEAGEPIRHGVVTVAETMARARSDRFGRYRIALPDEPATLLAFDNDCRVAALSLAPGVRKQGLRPLPDMELAPGLNLRGYVRDHAGEPLPDAPVVVRGHGVVRQVITGAGGAYACRGLIDGEYVVEPLPRRGAWGPRRHVRLSGSDVEVPEIRMRPSETKRIRVVDERADPIPEVHVVAIESESRRRAHGVTDAGGAVELLGLGDGTLSFEVRAPESWEPRPVGRFDVDQSLLVVAQ